MIFWILECIFSTCGFLTIALIGVVYYLFESNRLAELRQRYDILRERRQDHVKSAIDRLRKQLEGKDQSEDITKQTLVEIKDKLDKGELKASDVLEAFQSRALKLHDKYNCLVEPVFEAEEDAAAVDEKKRGGLLAGIPVSIKDDIGIKGYVTTAGLAKMLGSPSHEDSVLVKVLRKNGAVIFARTNIPQTESSAESSNPIYGTTLNPHNPNRNPGGSSSGEVPATWGPLARDVDSLVLAMRALWDGSMAEFDPLSPPLKFQTQLYDESKPMKIGYYYDDGFFPPVPVARRALDMAIEELKKRGHQVVEWVPPDVGKAFEFETKAIFADGGDNYMDSLEGDKIDPCIKLMVDGLRVPKFLRPLLPFLARMFMSERHGLSAEAQQGTGTVYKFWQLQGALKGYQSKITEEWKREGLDALLCPPQPFPALPLGNPEHAISGSGYMFLYNVLDYPAGVVRMTKQTEEDTRALKNYRTDPNFKFQEEIKEMVSQGEGLPVGVMVASLRWEDEKCLRVMKAVERAADFVIQ